MDFTVGVLLGTFVLSVLALFFFIWSMPQGLFGNGQSAAAAIFARNEYGIVGDPAEGKGLAVLGSAAGPVWPYYGAAGRSISTVWRPVK